MLAGVLAHELGHIEKRHNLKAIGTGLSLLTGATLLSLVIGTDAAGFMLNGLQFGTLKYSRDHEREADDAGVRILLNAGLSPRGLVRFFEKLKAKEGFGSSSALNLLSTHPMTEERISRLKARAADQPLQFNSTQWQRWSRHLAGDAWRPGVDGIHTFIQAIQQALMEARA